MTFMAVFPLQDALIDSVIEFVNANLVNPNQIHEFFDGTWRPDKLPKIRTCRSIQKELRGWLGDLSGAMHFDALMGRSSTGNSLDLGIRVEGGLGYRIHKDDGGKVHYEVTWKWWISAASLRNVCALAVVSIQQADLHEKVERCARAECDNFFIDRKSRGKRRENCGTVDCDAALNAARQKKWRDKKYGTSK